MTASGQRSVWLTFSAHSHAYTCSTSQDESHGWPGENILHVQVYLTNEVTFPAYLLLGGMKSFCTHLHL